jgi:hypothetical protein
VNRFRLLSVLMLVSEMSVARASDFKDLVSAIPEGSNALVLIDIGGVLSSPIAKANGWGGKLQDGAADRPVYLPPEADKVVIAASLDIARGFNRDWQVALMGLTTPLSMAEIARAEGGHADRIGNADVAWVPSDAYFLQVAPQVLGLMAPADRQATSRWMSNLERKRTGELTPYLAVVAAGVVAGPQITLALDATNAVQPHRVRTNLAASELAGKLDVAATAELISSLQGLTMQITFKDKVTSLVRVDFGIPVKLSNEIARTLVEEALDIQGMALPGMENWTCYVQDSSIMLAGDMDADALRRVMSLLEIPTTKFSSLKGVSTETATTDDVAKLSQAYFKSIDAMLTDLKRKTKASARNSDAVWNRRYAEKIDRLPILHVDEQLLDFGQKLSETLRIMSDDRQMNNLQGSMQERWERSSAGVQYSVDGYGYGAYNYYSPRQAEVNAGNLRADAQARGSATKIQGWTLINNALLDIRKVMTMKYGIEF